MKFSTSFGSRIYTITDMLRSKQNRGLTVLLEGGHNKQRGRLVALYCYFHHCDWYSQDLEISSQDNDLEALAAFCCCVGPTAIGKMLEYSSPRLDELEVEGIVKKIKLYGSIMTLGALFGAMLTGFFTDRFLRKDRMRSLAPAPEGFWGLWLYQGSRWEP